MKRKDLARRATSAALAACMMFTLSAPALAESTDALMQLSINSRSSISVLDAENTGVDEVSYGVTVKVGDAEAISVTSKNENDILENTGNAGKLRYSFADKKLISTGTITGNVVINAGGNDVVLDTCTVSDDGRVVLGDLTITNAKNVTLASRETKVIATGSVSINCTEKFEVPSCKRISSGGALTVTAGSVNINGNAKLAVVTGTIASDKVKIENASGGPAVANFTYNGDTSKYVYYTSADESAKPIDPRTTPISANANLSYVRIAPSTLQTITLDGEGVTVSAPGNQAYPGTDVTATATAPAGKRFEGWDVSENVKGNLVGNADLTKDTSITFTMPDSAATLKAEYAELHKLKVECGTMNVTDKTTDVNQKNNQTTTAADAAKGDVVEIEGINFNPDVKAFDHWEVKSGKAKLDDPYSEKTNLTIEDDGDVTAKAYYMTPRKVNVVDENGNVTGTATGKTKHGTENVIFAGDEVQVTANVPEGKQFDHWECDPALTDELTEEAKKDSTLTFKMPSSDVTLTAVYNNVYTVTAEDAQLTESSGIAGTEVTATQNVSDSEKFTGWAVVSAPADFIEWFNSLTEEQKKADSLTFNIPEGNVVLKAEHKTKHTVTVNGTPIRTDAVEGESITVDAWENAGIAQDKFERWKTNLKLSEKELTTSYLTFTMPNSDVEFTAVAKTLYNVTVTDGLANGQTSVDVKPGDTVTITAKDTITKDGEEMVFVGWYVDSGNVTPQEPTKSTTTFVMPSAAVKLTAQYKTKHTVTVQHRTDGSDVTTEDPAQEKHAIENEDITVTAADRTGEDLAFDHWEVMVGALSVDAAQLLGDVKDQTAKFPMQNADVTLTAVYKQLYTVTVKNDGITKETYKIKAGETLLIKADPIEGKRFKEWVVTTGNGNVKLDDAGADLTALTLESGGVVEVDAAYVVLNNVSVKFGTPVNKTVTTPTSAGPDGETILPAAKDDEITVTAKDTTPDQIFTGWTVEDGAILTKGGAALSEDDLKQPEITFGMPDSPVKLTANYSYVYDQTVTVKYGNDEGALSDSKVYTPGDSVSVTPEDRSAEDLVFAYWKVTQGSLTLSGDQESANPLNFTMPTSADEIILVAHYAKLHSITINGGTAEGDKLLAMADGTSKGAVEGAEITIKAAEKPGQVFDSWSIVKGGVTLTPTNEDGSEATFTMGVEEVVITANYKNLHTITVHGDDSAYTDTISNVKAGAEQEITARKIEGKRFDGWKVNSGITLDQEQEKANPLTIQMPDNDVDLTANYVALNNVSVKRGTPVNKTVETETTTETDSAGDEWTVLPAAENDIITVKTSKNSMETFEGWVLTGTIYDETGIQLTTDADGYLLDSNGEKILDMEFTFKMGTSEVSLTAVTSIPAYPQRTEVRILEGVAGGSDADNEDGNLASIRADERYIKLTAGGTVAIEKDGEWQETSEAISAGTRVQITADDLTDEMKEKYPGMVFDRWQIVYGDVTLDDATSQTTTFVMPKGGAVLRPHWAAAGLDPIVNPDESLDPDFAVDYDAPSDSGAGAAVVGVALGGAAVWGGYEITTRVMLKNLLPEGAAIPKNRGQLAMLIWTEKGKPEPAAQPAFADVADADMAKAAQWCVEQGLMDEKGESTFKPDGLVTKVKVIDTWNKAFPKQ